MRKLSTQDISEIQEMYKRGMQVSKIAQRFSVTIGAIKYQIKQNAEYVYTKPCSYSDHLKNQVARMEERLKNGGYTEAQQPYARSEIRRLKRIIRVDLNRFQNERE